MKHLALLIIFFLIPFEMHAQEEEIPLALTYAKVCLVQGHFQTAQEILQGIEKKCSQSNLWQNHCFFNQLKAQLYESKGTSPDSTLHYFKEAWQSHPSSEDDVDELYIGTALSYANLCISMGLYDECKQAASETLVWLIDKADSCLSTQYLFSLLAQCYESRGDTAMAEHMHNESILYSIRRINHAFHPDSVKHKEKLLNTFHEVLTFEKFRFDKDPTGYIEVLCDIAHETYLAGNVTETIRIGDKICKLQRQHKVNPELYAKITYVQEILLTQYALYFEMDKLEELLAEFIKNNKNANNYNIDFARTYFNIGQALMLNSHYQEALNYFVKAQSEITENNSPEFKEEIHTYIELCKKFMP